MLEELISINPYVRGKGIIFPLHTRILNPDTIYG
jgi:hypothetical protein